MISSQAQPQSQSTSLTNLAKRAQSCWVCRTNLTVPLDQYAYYTKHAHPVIANITESASAVDNNHDDNEVDIMDNRHSTTRLPIPLFVCFGCVGKFDNDNDTDDNDHHESSSTKTTTCALCLDDILLDETSSASFLTCPLHTICHVCRATCHGGDLPQSTASMPCPVCQPPPVLLQYAVEYQTLQQQQEQSAQEQEQNDDDPLQHTLGWYTAVQDEHSLTLLRLDVLDHCFHAMETTEFREFVHNRPFLPESTVHAAERMQHHNNNNNNNNNAIHQWYATMWRELHDTAAAATPAAARAFFQQLQHEQLAHEARVADTLSQIHEELEVVHGCDMAQLCAHYWQPKAVPAPNDPDYVQAANRAIEQRNARERQEAIVLQQQQERSQESDDDDDDDSISATGDLAKAGWIEDVGIDGSSGDEHDTMLQPRAKGFEGKWPRLPESTKKMQRLLEREQEIIQQYEIPCATVRERDDATENRRGAVRRSKQGCDVEYARLPQVRRRRATVKRQLRANQQRAKQKASASSSSSTQKRRASEPKELTPPVRKKAKRDVTPSPFVGAQPSSRHSTLSNTLEIFRNSSLVLPGSQTAIARDLATKLKPHQVQAVQCMWKNAFADYNTESDMAVGGCILAQ